MSIRDSRIEYVTVEHSLFGCWTGCCGWIAYAYDKEGNLLHKSQFDFMDSINEEDAIKFAGREFPGAKFSMDQSDWKCTT